MKRVLTWAKLWLLAVAALSVQVHEQAQAQERDPTRPPPEMNAAPVAGANPARASNPLGERGMAVLVRDGQPFVVSSTRLYPVGSMLGQYKVERISETEVWLRDGKELLKFPRFTGIQRRAAATERPTQ